MRKRRRKCHPHCKPGRHVFTHEESVRGYENAKLKMMDEHPDWLCQHGAHYSHCLLRVKNPLWFEVRKLQGQLSKLTAKVGKQDKKLRSIKLQLRKLQKTKGYSTVTHKPRSQKGGSSYVN
jgi:hypothetical protein